MPENRLVFLFLVCIMGQDAGLLASWRLRHAEVRGAGMQVKGGTVGVPSTL